MLWDVASGRLVLRLGVANSMTSCAFSPDGNSLAVGSQSIFGSTGALDLWDLHATRGQQTLRGLHGPISQVCLSANNQLVAALSQNWKLGIWDIPSNRLLRVFDAPKGRFAESAALAFDAEARRIAYACGTEAKVWDVSTGAALLSFELQPGFMDRMAFQGSDRLLLIRQESIDPRYLPYGRGPGPTIAPRVCRIRDLLAAEPLKPLHEITDFPLTAMAILAAPNGKQVVIEGLEIEQGKFKRAIMSFELLTARRQWKLPSEFVRDTTRLRAFETTGKYLLMFDADLVKYVSVDAANGKQVREFDSEPIRIGPGSTSQVVLVSPKLGGKPRIALVRPGNDSPVLSLAENPAGLDSVLFSNDGNHLVWGNLDGTVTVFDTGRVHARLTELGLGWDESRLPPSDRNQ
jgi:WD40 repeat protein